MDGLFFYILLWMRDSMKLLFRSVKPSRATCHRQVAFYRFESPLCNKKYGYPNGYPYFLAEDEGFEPPQTESESGVLPLHKSSIC